MFYIKFFQPSYTTHYFCTKEMPLSCDSLISTKHHDTKKPLELGIISKVHLFHCFSMTSYTTRKESVFIKRLCL